MRAPGAPLALALALLASAPAAAQEGDAAVEEAAAQEDGDRQTTRLGEVLQAAHERGTLERVLGERAYRLTIKEEEEDDERGPSLHTGVVFVTCELVGAGDERALEFVLESYVQQKDRPLQRGWFRSRIGFDGWLQRVTLGDQFGERVIRADARLRGTTLAGERVSAGEREELALELRGDEHPAFFPSLILACLHEELDPPLEGRTVYSGYEVGQAFRVGPGEPTQTPAGEEALAVHIVDPARGQTRLECIVARSGPHAGRVVRTQQSLSSVGIELSLLDADLDALRQRLDMPRPPAPEPAPEPAGAPTPPSDDPAPPPLGAGGGDPGDR